MQDTHPLIELLEVSSHDVLLAPYNYRFFTSLKAALISDSKSVFSMYEDNTELEESISDTAELHSNQTELLKGVIGSWAVSVMTPLVEALNEIGDDTEAVGIHYDGDLTSGKLYLSNMECYVQSLVPNQHSEVIDELVGWKNSKVCIGNIEEFEQLLESEDNDN